MDAAMWIAKTGLEAQQRQMSSIANNLANVNTKGFKRERVIFEDLLYVVQRQAGGSSSQSTELPSGLNQGTGVRVVATQKIHTEGSISQTGNALDLAITGRGFFQVQLPDGTTGYSRDGQFQLDATGQMVTSSGYVLQPAITIPSGALSTTIGRDGTVSVLTAGSTTPTNVGQIQIADFVNMAGLQPLGENVYAETAASGSATTGAPGSTGLGLIAQGSIEASNVNAVEELVGMIETSRAYEMNSKVIATVDEMLRFANQTIA